MSNSRLLIIGVYPDSEAYPNIYHRVRALQREVTLSTTTVHRQGWSSDTQSSSGRARLWRNFGTMLWAHISVLRQSLFRTRPDITYIPYPAVGLLWLLSFFGKRWLSDRIVVDAFISLYDTIILDRKLYSATSLLARLLWRIERRAYRFADLVIVDTAESASHLAELFSLPPALFCACPLSTDETVLQPQPYPVLSPAGNNISNGKCRILFIGTMIPLHGIDTIVACARLLEDDPLTITVIGNGQQGASVSAAGGNIHWLREWVDSPGIAQVIAEADVCLGIFGATDKADRVLPYKIYAYSRVGRAVITAATPCLTNLTRELDYSPFILVPVADAEALAEAIRELASRPQLRAQYAAASARFYAENLSNQALQAKLLGALAGV